MLQIDRMPGDALRAELLDLAHELGREDRQLAVLGEGNVSADCGDGTFLVKASGSSLATLAADELSRVAHERVRALLDGSELDEEGIEAGLRAALIDPGERKPSVETFLHALCLTVGGAHWVGHTHTVSVNQLLCSRHGAAAFARHVFPDVVVVCGRHVASVPYVDPGLPLARAVEAELRRFAEAHGRPPKLLLMENHGPVALGQSATEVLNVMLMADKWARTLVGAYAVGGPSFLAEADADRIDGRLDEAYRRRRLTNQ